MKTYEFLVTKSCNLSCSYCYIDQDSSMMPTSVVNHWFDMIARRGEECNISVFGGEPTLNPEAVQYISERAQALALVKEAKITVNGSIKPIDVVSLKNLGYDVTVSYDGVWDSETRNTLSATTEEDAIAAIIESGNRPNVMVAPNGLQMAQNYDYFMSKGIIPSFKLVRDDVWTERAAAEFKKNFAMLCAAFEERLVKKGENCPPGILKEALERMISAAATGSKAATCNCGVDHVSIQPDGVCLRPCARFESLDSYKDESIGAARSTGRALNESANAMCSGCADRDFCEKQCVASAWVNGFALAPTLCDMFKSVHKQAMLLNRRLRDNTIWQQAVMKVIDGGEIDG